MTARFFIFTILAISFLSTNVSSMEMENHDTAVLGALNKITGKTSLIEAHVGEVASFGDLEIKILSCQKSSPLDPPESASYLKIKNGDNILFSGWMYASSPALSAMENGIYDIWVKDCKKEDL
jgi:hypothetical protein